MTTMNYILKVKKNELGVVINALHHQYKKQLQQNEADARIADLLLRLLAFYDKAK